MTNLETYDFLNDALTHLLKLLGTGKDTITSLACDLHPAFHSSRLAKEWASELDLPLVPIQHHHAHHAAVLADNRVQLDEPAISITIDGVGYGSDGMLWGGEILAGAYDIVERKGHLQPIPMPGGDLAVKYPARMLMSIFSTFLSPEEICAVPLARPFLKMLPKRETELAVISRQLNHPKNMPYTTSLGRVLDALAISFGVCIRRTYDGEPAMRFESFANNAPIGNYIPPFEIPVKIHDNIQELTTPALFQWLVEQKAFSARRATRQAFAYACHVSISRALAKMALATSAATGVKKIGLTGGVTLNHIISSEIKRVVRKEGVEFLEHMRVPPGDAGISFGQCAVAASLALHDK
ncbi:MAG: (NiFe) hydrogenase maturation protein HypF [Promethearchaeota archaeon CR_4]|nr:MAG: (NiFe) hydrogenase maturation protein HypF [Candidatus Lokiarchaeota archaeon CR_4]